MKTVHLKYKIHVVSASRLVQSLFQNPKRLFIFYTEVYLSVRDFNSKTTWLQNSVIMELE